jgi:hypothetical protein
MTTEVEHGTQAQQRCERDLAVRFQFVSHAAEMAAKGAPLGHRASAYAKVMADNGFGDLDMREVRRLVGD